MATLPASEHVGELPSEAARFTLAREVYLKLAVTVAALVSCHGNVFLLPDEAATAAMAFTRKLAIFWTTILHLLYNSRAKRLDRDRACSSCSRARAASSSDMLSAFLYFGQLLIRPHPTARSDMPNR